MSNWKVELFQKISKIPLKDYTFRNLEIKI